MSSSLESSGDRQPPSNIDAEAEVLGGILLDPEALMRVSELLRPEAFYMTAHQEVYRATLMLHARGQPTDLTSVSAWLEDHKLLERVGGTAMLRRLVEQTVSSINIDQYAKIILDKYVRRQLIRVGAKAAELAYDASMEIPQVMDRIEQEIFEVTQERVKRSLVPAADILLNIFTDLEAKSQNGTDFPGVPTGFYDLDNMTQGFQRSDLIIVAGRPSMGKTAICLNMAHNIAVKTKLPVAIFSLEMSREQLVQRLLASEAKISGNRLRSGRISENEWQRLSQAIGHLAQLPIFIDDTANATVTEIRSKTRRMQAEQGGALGMVLLDYLQLMEGVGSENRVQELARITRGLKGLAKELEAPIVVLSQLSRAVESRSDKRPQLSDLRESGCLAGDTVLLEAATGKPWRLDQLARSLVYPALWSLWPQDQIQAQVPLKVFGSGIKPVFRLVTAQGLAIAATANHPFWTPTGWQPLGDLAVGDTVAIAPNQTLAWDEVVSIEPLGPQAVYDITMPTHPNFVANGFVVHNSIEQDADLVLMLYRAEYYDANTPDKGIAEVIVAKHRNGPTGNIRLLFENEYTQFRNLAER